MELEERPVPVFHQKGGVRTKVSGTHTTYDDDRR